MADRTKRINPELRGEELISALNRPFDGEIMVVDFSDTLQGKDTSRVVDLMPNKDGKALFRVKFNSKAIDPLAAAEYGTNFVDTSVMSDEKIEEFLKRSEFDFPLWFKHTPGFKMGRAVDYNAPFILQVAGCNFHDGTPTGGCRFCFVDNESNDGVFGPKKAWLSVDDCIDSFLRARDKVYEFYMEWTGKEVVTRVLRISGGEPTLVLDWILKLWQAIEKRGLLDDDCDIVGQVDTNCSTMAILDQGILETLSSYPVKFLAGMKGCDSKNIAGNVQAEQTVTRQMNVIKTLVDCGIDVFPQMYNPDPATLRLFLELVDNFVIDNFSRRVHISPLKLYGPTRRRLELEADALGIDRSFNIDQSVEQWSNNYSESIAVLDAYLRDAYGIGYRDEVRSDVKLENVSDPFFF